MAGRRTARTERRPLRADGERNRARVLEVARAVFAREGLAVPVEEIARRSGVGVGTVYRHFPTKEALYEAIVVDRFEQLLVEADALERAEPGPAFFGFLSRAVEEICAKRDLVDALTGAGLDVRATMMPVTAPIKAALAKLLTRAQVACIVRSDVGIDDVMALLRAMALTHGVDRNPGVHERVFAILCDGLRTKR